MPTFRPFQRALQHPRPHPRLRDAQLLVAPLLAAVIGGGVTAAVLLGAGVVDGARRRTVDRARRCATRPPALAATARGGLDRARHLQARRARRGLHPRRRRCAADPSPFDVDADAQPARGRPAPAS